MKNRKTVFLFSVLVTLALVVFACKKEKQECVTCYAVCAGSGSTQMKNCSDDNDVLEERFRNQHSGCTITCTREHK